MRKASSIASSSDTEPAAARAGTASTCPNFLPNCKRWRGVRTSGWSGDVMMALSREEVWNELARIKDPEIPVVSLVELGIVRGVELDGERVLVTITPTFAGCPAMHAMREEIVERLQAIALMGGFKSKGAGGVKIAVREIQ